MVHKCSVPHCLGNYHGGPKVHVFSFPNDTSLNNKWLRALRSKNFTLTSNSRVCELHFDPEDLQIQSEHVVDGKIVTLPYRHIRLKAGAIPKIIPSNLKFLNSPKTSTSSADTRKRKHCSALAEVPDDSNEQLTNFDTFLTYLDNNVFEKDWMIVKRNKSVAFVHLSDSFVPTVSLSAVFNSKFELKLYVKGNIELTKLARKSYPRTLDDLNELKNVLRKLKTAYNIESDSSVDVVLDNAPNVFANLQEELKNRQNIKINYIIYK